MSGHRGEADIAVARAEVRKCEGFRMPAHDDGATHSGAGVRKPPREETAGGGAKQRVRRYGIFGAGDLLPAYIEQLSGRRSKGWRAQLADRDSSTGVAQQRLIDEAVVQGRATPRLVTAGLQTA